MSESPQVTAVICTHNRVGYLQACIDSLLLQSVARPSYEILVIDNASTDDTAALCRPLAERGDIRYVHEPVTGLSQARNTGWREARAPYVGYLDDDAKADQTWIESALHSFNKVTPPPAWVGGPIDLDFEYDRPEWIDEDMSVALGKVDWGDTAHALLPHERLGGGNSFYLKALLEDIGGFDTRLGRKGDLLLSGEETQLQRRVENAGGALYYHPGIRIFHHVPAARIRPSFFYRRYFWGGVTDYGIARTLGPKAQKTVDATSREEASGRWGRLLSNVAAAAGLASSQHARIRGRIYLSYVLGQVGGRFFKGRYFSADSSESEP